MSIRIVEYLSVCTKRDGLTGALLRCVYAEFQCDHCQNKFLVLRDEVQRVGNTCPFCLKAFPR
jgi:hypothetical protein